MNEYDVKIVMVSSWSDSFNRVANNLCAKVVEQGYRFHSVTPLTATQENGGKVLYSQTFVFEKGAKNA